MISKKEVQHVAKLARLGIAKKEEARFQKELSSILDYIEKLKEVDILGVEATSHPRLVENVMRKDEKSAEHKMQGAKLLELAPETKDGYIRVKPILK